MIDLLYIAIKNNTKKRFKAELSDYYEKLITTKLHSFDESSKLFIYSKIKNTFNTEKYLLNINNFNSRQLITKFRISDHNLEIELGRYKKVPRDQRLCKTCKVLDNEEHFFLHVTLTLLLE